MCENSFLESFWIISHPKLSSKWVRAPRVCVYVHRRWRWGGGWLMAEMRISRGWVEKPAKVRRFCSISTLAISYFFPPFLNFHSFAFFWFLFFRRWIIVVLIVLRSSGSKIHDYQKEWLLYENGQKLDKMRKYASEGGKNNGTEKRGKCK